MNVINLIPEPIRKFIGISLRMIAIGILLSDLIAPLCDLILNNLLDVVFQVLFRPTLYCLIFSVLIFIFAKPTLNSVNKFLWFFCYEDGEWVLVYKTYAKVLVVSAIVLFVIALLSYLLHSETLNWWDLPLFPALLIVYLLTPLLIVFKK